MASQTKKEGDGDRVGGPSRRGLLTGAAGALGVLGAEALLQATPASAGTDGDVVLGAQNVETSVTSIVNTNPGTGLYVEGGDGGAGVRGFGGTSSGAGVWGFGGPPNGTGVRGTGIGTGAGVIGSGASNSASTGVQGTGQTGVHGDAGYTVGGVGVFGETSDTTSETYGVEGRTSGSLGRAVFGWSLNSSSGGTGVWGQSNSGTGVGVRGYAWDDGLGSFGTGVMGTSGSTTFPPPPSRPNTGVCGVSVAPSGGTGSAGVVGDSTTNAGVLGFTSATSRAAGEFTHTAGGVALSAHGFLQCSTAGRATVAAGAKKVTVTVAGVVPTDTVLATVQSSGSLYVKNATAGTGKLTISISKAPTSPLIVGYLVLRT